MAVEKIRKGKRKFERKMKRYKLCREEMEVTEEPKIVKLLYCETVSFPRILFLHLKLFTL